MKKYIFLLIIILLTFTIVQGQTNVYHPFPDSNAVWRVNSLTGCPVGYSISAHSSYQYTIGGDTIIGPYLYKKIFRSGNFAHCAGGDNIDTVYQNNYHGALRQDTINKKVYYKYQNKPDVLLYDFNLQVGDTFQLVSFDWGYIVPVRATVQSVDSVLVGNSYHKQFHFFDGIVNGYPLYFPILHSIIEGVGATSGLLEPIYDMDPMNSWDLFCFSHNSNIYPASSTACPLITEINEPSLRYNDVKVYPNPSNSRFNIETGSVNKKNIDVFDINGRHVFGDIIREKGSIDVGNLNEGIYILRIKTASFSINKKLIILH